MTLRFLIMDAPTPTTVPAFVKELQRFKVRHLVRVCHQTYRTDVIEMADIQAHAWPFDDGSAPPPAVLKQWLELIDTSISAATDGQAPTIAIHCVAGLGRAPMLVCIALIEFCGYAPLDAIMFIRERRRGAINQTQLDYVTRYKPRAAAGRGWDVCCAIQ